MLSTHEVWEKAGTSVIDSYDAAWNQTRQLDYYSSQNVTTKNYSGAIKQYNGSNDWWWLRSASSNDSDYFYGVYSYGNWSGGNSNELSGVSPAFRIG